MPRKVDPHRHEQTEDWPTDFVDTFELPDTIEKLLPEELSPEQKNLALEQIRYALGEYKWELEAGPHRYGRAEAAKGLRDLLAVGDFTRPALGSLNQRAYNLLYDLTPGRDAKRWMLDFDDSAPPEAALRDGIDRALRILNARNGPEKPVPLGVLVMRLCFVFEAATGQPVRHSTKTRDLAYSQEAQSSAGQFVTAVIREVYEDVRPTMVNRHLRDFVKFRPEPF